MVASNEQLRVFNAGPGVLCRNVHTTPMGVGDRKTVRLPDGSLVEFTLDECEDGGAIVTVALSKYLTFKHKETN